MPLPLILAPLAGASLSTALNSALAGLGLATVYNTIKPYIEEIMNSESFKGYLISQVSAIIVDEVFKRTGLALNPDDPLTKASFTQAIGAKLGISLTDLTDANAVAADIGKFVADTINARAGTEFATLSLSSPMQLKAELSEEIVAQIGKSLAGVSSAISPEHISLIRTMALAGTGNDGTPQPIPYTPKRRLRARAAAARYYQSQKRNGFVKKWVYTRA